MCRSFRSNHDKTVILTAILLFDSAPAYKKRESNVNKQKFFVNFLIWQVKTLDFFKNVCYNFLRIVINSAKEINILSLCVICFQKMLSDWKASFFVQ